MKLTRRGKIVAVTTIYVAAIIFGFLTADYCWYGVLLAVTLRRKMSKKSKPSKCPHCGSSGTKSTEYLYRCDALQECGRYY